MPSRCMTNTDSEIPVKANDEATALPTGGPDTNANGLRAAATVRSFLEAMELAPVVQRIGASIAFHVDAEGPAEQGVAQVYVEAERFVFSFVLAGQVPASRRSAAAELILRTNWRLIEGSFGMDFDTGVVHYRAGIDFSSTELTEPLIRNAMLAGMAALEAFAEPLIAVTQHGAEPAAAMNKPPPA
jgi:hypothetical protein